VPLFKASVEAFKAWRARWPGAVVGTLLSATTDYRAADYRRPTLILMGNEQAGLPPENPRLQQVRGVWDAIIAHYRGLEYDDIAEAALKTKPAQAVDAADQYAEIATIRFQEEKARRDLVRRLDANQPIYAVRSIEEVYELTVKQRMDIIREIIGGLGLLGLALALVGLYGLMSYSVGLRHREIGIRMAIGADPAAVVKMVLRQGMVLATSGAAIGLVLSLAASKLTAALPGGHAFDLALIAPVLVALLAMAALGVYLPARRASLVDPNTVLRQE